MKILQIPEDAFYETLRDALSQDMLDGLWQKARERSIVRALESNRGNVVRLLTAMSKSDGAKLLRHNVIFEAAVALLCADAPRELPVAVDILLEHVQRNLETHGTTDSENIAELVDLVKSRTDPRFAEIDACFEAAYAEGLTDAIEEAASSRLVDLVQRRLLPARTVAQNAMQAMSEADWRIALAREIWRFNERPWKFDNPETNSGQLYKQACIDLAENIRLIIFQRLQIAPSASKRARELADIIESDDFQCEAGPLKNRREWQDFKKLIGGM